MQQVKQNMILMGVVLVKSNTLYFSSLGLLLGGVKFRLSDLLQSSPEHKLRAAHYAGSLPFFSRSSPLTLEIWIRGNLYLYSLTICVYFLKLANGVTTQPLARTAVHLQ
ncbi:hypothetical protein XELAEV_18016336mg [Xenopus laevis]|uniref:Uncharacterized protein n=1 Tax=Xenopus laevis TaxID=8355 RepID=A0A974DLA2_XENLA|nr:hypothetical protein XELAEV_18016336mg [Xenopus laevis]